MKKLFALIAALTLLLSVSACSDGDKGESDFVYYFGVEKSDENDEIVVYALMKENRNKAGNDEKGAFVEEYTGKDIGSAFGAFFDRYKNAYTGTVKEYAVGKNMGKEGLEDFKIYLTNSSQLPAKRKTVFADSAYEYMSEKEKEEALDK